MLVPHVLIRGSDYTNQNQYIKQHFYNPQTNILQSGSTQNKMQPYSFFEAKSMISKEFVEHTANNRNEKRVLLILCGLPVILWAMWATKLGAGMEVGFAVSIHMSPAVAIASVLIGVSLTLRQRHGDLAFRALTWASRAIMWSAAIPAGVALYLSWAAGDLNPALLEHMGGNFALGTVIGALVTHAVAGVFVTAPIRLGLLLIRRKNPLFLLAQEVAR